MTATHCSLIGLMLAASATVATVPQVVLAADEDARMTHLETRMANLEGRMAVLEAAKSKQGGMKGGMMMDHGSGMSGSDSDSPMGRTPQPAQQMPPASGGMGDM